MKNRHKIWQWEPFRWSFQELSSTVNIDPDSVLFAAAQSAALLIEYDCQFCISVPDTS